MAQHARRTVVRAATEDDIAAVHRVRVTTWRDAYAGIVPAEVLERMRTDDAEAIAEQRARFRQAPVLTPPASRRNGRSSRGLCGRRPRSR